MGRSFLRGRSLPPLAGGRKATSNNNCWRQATPWLLKLIRPGDFACPPSGAWDEDERPAMCGIVGYLDKRGRAAVPTGRLVLTMLEALACRGPDSAGVALLRDVPTSGPALDDDAWTVRIAPGDPLETRGATRAVAGQPGPCYLRLGKANEPVVHATEPDFAIVECMGGDNACRITPACKLRGALNEALAAFVAVLDDYTLADLTLNPREFGIRPAA